MLNLPFKVYLKITNTIKHPVIFTNLFKFLLLQTLKLPFRILFFSHLKVYKKNYKTLCNFQQFYPKITNFNIHLKVYKKTIIHPVTFNNFIQISTFRKSTHHQSSPSTHTKLIKTKKNVIFGWLVV